MDPMRNSEAGKTFKSWAKNPTKLTQIPSKKLNNQNSDASLSEKFINQMTQAKKFFSPAKQFFKDIFNSKDLSSYNLTIATNPEADLINPFSRDSLNKTPTHPISENSEVKQEEIDPMTSSINQEVVETESKNAEELLNLANKEGPIDPKPFIDWVGKMKNGGHKQELGAILDKVLTPNILKNKERDFRILDAFVLAVEKNFPVSVNYVKRLDYKTPLQPGNMTLSDDCVDIIAAHLRKKGTLEGVAYKCTFPASPWLAQDSSNNLSRTFLQESITQMVKNPQAPQKIACIVYNGGHHLPIFIERTKDGKFRGLISDSVCTPEYYERALREIRHTFKNLKIPYKNIELFCHKGLPRQTSRSDCALFAIRDIAVLAKNSDHIFDWINKYGKASQASYHDEYDQEEGSVKENLNYKTIEFLPPKMMSITQSIGKVNTEYMAKLPAAATSGKMPSKKPDKNENLMENRERHIFSKQVTEVDDEGKEYQKTKVQNKKTEDFLRKYEKMILLGIITSNLKIPEYMNF